MDEWEDFAKRLKTSAEEEAAGSKNPGEGMDISQSHVAKEIGAVWMGESDANFDETVFEFINSTWKDYEEEAYVLRCNFRRTHDQRVGRSGEKGRDGDLQ